MNPLFIIAARARSAWEHARMHPPVEPFRPEPTPARESWWVRLVRWLRR
ncbi:MAG TPA: hypothetical protein VGM23_09745 [Armatimonadota bacterium]|jgi:hypothetical protein